MLDWEQISVGMQLHGYKDHGQLPVCGLEAARRRATDPFPRTTYHGPMPPPDDLICQTCKTYERDTDPMFIAGREYERQAISRLLGKEANRIYNKQAQDFPSNVLDAVSLNLMMGETEELSRRR